MTAREFIMAVLAVLFFSFVLLPAFGAEESELRIEIYNAVGQQEVVPIHWNVLRVTKNGQTSTTNLLRPYDTFNLAHAKMQISFTCGTDPKLEIGLSEKIKHKSGDPDRATIKVQSEVNTFWSWDNPFFNHDIKELHEYEGDLINSTHILFNREDSIELIERFFNNSKQIIEISTEVFPEPGYAFFAGTSPPAIIIIENCERPWKQEQPK